MGCYTSWQWMRLPNLVSYGDRISPVITVMHHHQRSSATLSSPLSSILITGGVSARWSATAPPSSVAVSTGSPPLHMAYESLTYRHASAATVFASPSSASLCALVMNGMTYDDAWSVTHDPQLPSSLYGSASITSPVTGQVYICGGCEQISTYWRVIRPKSPPLSCVWMFIPASSPSSSSVSHNGMMGSWKRAANMSYGRYLGVAVWWRSAIYIIGGGTQTDEWCIERYDEQHDRWTIVTRGGQPRQYPYAVSVPQGILRIGMT